MEDKTLSAEAINRIRELIIGADPEAVAMEDVDALCDMALRAASMKQNDRRYVAIRRLLIAGATNPIDRIRREARTTAEVDAAIDQAIRALREKP